MPSILADASQINLIFSDFLGLLTNNSNREIPNPTWISFFPWHERQIPSPCILESVGSRSPSAWAPGIFFFPGIPPVEGPWDSFPEIQIGRSPVSNQNPPCSHRFNWLKLYRRLGIRILVEILFDEWHREGHCTCAPNWKWLAPIQYRYSEEICLRICFTTCYITSPVKV